MSEGKPCDGSCADCDCEFQADRNAEFLQELTDIVYQAMAEHSGPPDDLSDKEFKVLTAAVLSLVQTTLVLDLQVLDLSVVNQPAVTDVNVN